MKPTCCEFRQIELGKDKDKLLSRMYEDLKRQILDGKKELWCQNRVAYVKYKCCDKCRERMRLESHPGVQGRIAGEKLRDAYLSINHKIKPWYPSFIVRWMIKRALKNANKNKP